MTTLGLWKIMQARLEWDLTCLSKEMKRCMPKSVNYDKVWEVTQEKDEGWRGHQEVTQAQTIVSCQKEETGRGECLECPFCGMLEGQPQSAPFLANLSQMRDSLALDDGANSAHFQISSTHPHITPASGHPQQMGECSVDTGTTCSVLTWPTSPLSNHDCTETGVDRQPKRKGGGEISVSPCLQTWVHYCYLLLFCMCQNVPSSTWKSYTK